MTNEELEARRKDFRLRYRWSNEIRDGIARTTNIAYTSHQEASAAAARILERPGNEYFSVDVYYSDYESPPTLVETIQNLPRVG